ncbi:RNA-guided endonuclease InsQ/TnpB family protein [Streptomyces telluris]|uniref:Transposase n=1 Tax=Streptomyces telluris TaxID=2720021 RepID=A0A9X2LLV6_9ACTN|nr:RNA-guided endonuclease TnpB family protein [Streptomyces telluris]MCQ8773719.1 transposase [Streptomyces telluris]NJP76872.1 transposase [Streptomyces telluris]
MLVGRKYRLALDSEQSEVAEGFGDICRAVWNTGLEQRRAYRQRGGWMSYVQQAREMAEAKSEHPWLRAAPSHILQQTLRDLDRACRAHGTFSVRWKSKTRWRPSFRFPDPKQITVERLNRKWARVRLPKLGWVRFRWTRPLDGAVKAATLSRDGAQWHISFLVETGRKAPAVSLERGRVGVDRGVVFAAATDDGRFFDRTFISPGEAARYRRLQQQLARTRKGSKRRKSCMGKMGRIMRRVRNRRRDFHARTACRIVDGNALVVLERLPVRNMTASARGTVSRPGTKVRQKAGLNRAILDKGWHGLELAIRNRARKTGAVVRKVNPAYTSQTCPVCGHVDSNSRKSQAKFVCTSCGYAEHADTVGAKNTLARGHTGFRAWRPRGCPVREAPTDSRGNPAASSLGHRAGNSPASAAGRNVNLILGA